MVKFFKLVWRNSAEIGSQKGARTHRIAGQQQRSAGRLVDRRAQRAQGKLGRP